MARAGFLASSRRGNDPTVEQICWDQVANELERRGLLGESNTFLFTDSWDRSARLALATRGKAPVACYNLERSELLTSGAAPKTGWAATGSLSKTTDARGVSRTTTNSSRSTNRSAPRGSSATASSSASSTSTVAPTRPGPSRSTAASGRRLRARRPSVGRRLAALPIDRRRRHYRPKELTLGDFVGDPRPTRGVKWRGLIISPQRFEGDVKARFLRL